MKATREHYFYAKDWPLKIWFGVISVMCLVAAIAVTRPTMAVLKDWRSLLWLGAIVVMFQLLGYFAGILVGWFILGPIYYDRMLKNGGPFKVGDYVQILVGPHEDRVVRVYSLWQGDTVRVELGEREKDTFRDVYAPTKLLKQQDGETGEAANKSDEPRIETKKHE